MNMKNPHQNFETLIQKIEQLEHRLNSLEKSREIENFPGGLTNAVRITGALDLPKITKLNLSTDKLVEIYNDVPEILANNAVEVTLTSDSYRQNTNGEIFVEKSKNGNYWVIAKYNLSYWLLPKGSLKINILKQKSLKSLFTFQGQQSDYVNEFMLIQPASVSMMPSGQLWKLQELGILEFSNTPSSVQLESELARINDEQTRLILLLKQTDIKHKQMQSEIKRMYNNVTLLQSQISEIRDVLLKLMELYQKINSQ
jgi:hypothetical protein